VPEREYIWLPLDGQAWALPLALVTDAGTASPRLHYLHADHLGTPLAMTSANLGQLEWSATYRPFGEPHSTSGTESLSLRFPGQLFDSETGFHQNWRRDYDPLLGRYLQPDPIGLEGGDFGGYSYVYNDPFSFIDPEGLFADTVLDLALVSYDLAQLALDGPCNVDENLAALTADLLGAVLPGATGLGLVTCSVGRYGKAGGMIHAKNARPSVKSKHEKGLAAKDKSRGGEKGDKSGQPPRKRPKGHKGPWPPTF
jgi:RHS repeat-associated protein